MLRSADEELEKYHYSTLSWNQKCYYNYLSVINLRFSKGRQSVTRKCRKIITWLWNWSLALLRKLISCLNVRLAGWYCRSDICHFKPVNDDDDAFGTSKNKFVRAVFWQERPSVGQYRYQLRIKGLKLKFKELMVR